MLCLKAAILTGLVLYGRVSVSHRAPLPPKVHSENRLPGYGEYFAPPEMVESLTAKCSELGSIEESQVKATQFLSYREKLQSWRLSYTDAQPTCRLESLGKSLCAWGEQLGKFEKWETDKEKRGVGGLSHWEKVMLELNQHVSTPSHCANFSQFVTNKWEPTVFQAIDSSSGLHMARSLIQWGRTTTTSKFSPQNALHALQVPYGAPNQAWWFVDGSMKFRKKRVQNLNYFRMLHDILPDWRGLESVSQFVEFGGGTGDVAACLRHLGYSLNHFVVDLPAMNLFHRYWLRYSGVPAVLGREIGTKFIETVKNGQRSAGLTFLESSMAQTWTLPNHLDGSLDSSSVFMGTYSFTEADVGTRERVRPWIEKFELIFIVFWSSWDGNDNDGYIRQWLKGSLDRDKEGGGLEKTHNVQIWKHEGNGFYMVARRKDSAGGKILCLKEWNCAWYTKHHSLPQGGLRYFLIKVVSVVVIGAVALSAGAVQLYGYLM